MDQIETMIQAEQNLLTIHGSLLDCMTGLFCFAMGSHPGNVYYKSGFSLCSQLLIILISLDIQTCWILQKLHLLMQDGTAGEIDASESSGEQRTLFNTSF